MAKSRETQLREIERKLSRFGGPHKILSNPTFSFHARFSRRTVVVFSSGTYLKMMQPITLDMDGQLASAFEENKELKSRLRNVEVAHQDLEFEVNFHKAKAEELQDIIQARTEDQIHEKLVSKALHNAELSHELKKVNAELKEARLEMERLSKERVTDKSILLQLSDIVRTLQHVPVDYEKVSASTENGNHQDASLANIRRKIETMMEDRMNIIDTCQWLQDEITAKDHRIEELEAKLYSQNDDANLRNHLSLDIALKPLQHGPNGDPQSPEPTYASTSTSPSTPSSFTSSVGMENVVDYDETSKEEEVKILNIQLEQANERFEDLKKECQLAVDRLDEYKKSATEESDRLKCQLDQANKRYEDLKNEWQKGSLKLEIAERQLEDAEASAEMIRKKRDAFKSHLKDVIDQYKGLHVLHDASIAKIKELNMATSKLKSEKKSIMMEKEALEQEKEAWIKEMEETTKAKHVLMSEMQSLVDEKQRLADENSQLIEEKETLEETQEMLMEEKNALHAENDTLILEKQEIIDSYGDTMTISEFQEEISRLVEKNQALTESNTSLAKEEKRVREEMNEWMESHEKQYESSVADYLEAEQADLPALQQAYLAAVAKITIVERKQSVAEQEIETFTRKKVQTDRNLRDAICRRKKLEDRLDATVQELEDSKRDLKNAKIEADRQREEAKHARRRLTGCLRQVKRLLVDQKEAQATIASMKADQHKRWNDSRWNKESMHKMLLIEATVTARAWRTQRELQVEKNLLVRERNELKAFCEDVLHEVGSQESGTHPTIVDG